MCLLIIYIYIHTYILICFLLFIYIYTYLYVKLVFAKDNILHGPAMEPACSLELVTNGKIDIKSHHQTINSEWPLLSTYYLIISSRCQDVVRRARAEDQHTLDENTLVHLQNPRLKTYPQAGYISKH